MGVSLSTSDSSSEYYSTPNSPDLSFNNQSNENFTSQEKHSVACQTDLSFQKDLSIVDPYWEVLDPKPDIHVLFEEFNAKFFGGQLPPIDLKWSNRLSSTAGLCIYNTRTGICKLRLNKPLLELRARKDTVQIYHDFNQEYESLKRHWWKCNGPCQEVVKRLTDRTPGTKAHKRKCGGDFIKIQEPENKRMRTDP
ncbi:sprT-like domain-containing protein Spartan [Xenopus tropicalis]|uniref:SprT-like domain-containing protein Spartan n=1 Tax=Xenopus tropicalis TaxID=8364 RepID=A0A8J0QI00_XENTR|nr:sprT-like domain-containing protein Spartan [Xenopus tropicalis]